MKTQVLMTACKSYLNLASIAIGAWENCGMQTTLYHMQDRDELPYPGSVSVPLDQTKVHRQQCWMYLLYATSLFDDDQLCMIADADLIPMRCDFFYELEQFAIQHPNHLICTEYGTSLQDLGRIRAHHVMGYAGVWKRFLQGMTFDELYEQASEVGRDHNRFAIDEMWLTTTLVNRHLSFPLRVWCDQHDCVPFMTPSAYNWPFSFSVACLHMPRMGDEFYQTTTYDEVLKYVDERIDLGR